MPAGSSSSTEWPSSIFPPLGWFSNDQTATTDCSVLKDDFDNTDGGDAGIAGNSLSAFTTGRYLSERYLYRKLSKNPRLVQPGSVFAAFQSQNINSVIGKFYGIEEDMATTMNIDIPTRVALHENYELLGLLNEQMLMQDSLLALDAVQDSLNSLLIRNSLLSQIDSLTLANLSLVSSIKAQRVANANGVISANAAISTSTVFEDNDKTVNDIYLTTIASGTANFSLTQIATLTSIADQCPAQGGNAVFRARSILNTVISNKVYDDKAICSLREHVPSNRVAEIAWPVTVYPNPASSSISFGLLPTGGNGLVVLKDMVGRQVLNSAIDLASGNTKLDVSQLQPAVYLVQLIEKGKVVFSGKVVLIR